MNIYFDSKDIACKKPFGAVKSGEEIEFNVFCEVGVFVESIHLIIREDSQVEAKSYQLDFISNKDNYSKFSTKIKINETGLYWYCFDIYTEYGKECCLKNGAMYQLTIYDKKYTTSDSVKGGIIYHAFVDRFNKGLDDKAIFTKKGHLKNWDDKLTIVDEDGVYRANDFYGGNFQGIIDKLDYLKSLNVSMLYLSPIFKSASTHRYDTGDYSQVDELLGTEEKFKELIDKAKAKGISIMLDGVFNHTGADSKYFNKFNTYNSLGAFQSKDSPYYPWYTFYNFPNDYHCWWGVTVCPTISANAQGFQDMIAGKDGIVEKWTKLGVKGWRLDVVDELQENFVEKIRKAMKDIDNDSLLIGEVWEDASNKIAYDYRRHYFQGKQLDGVMNYVYKRGILDYVKYNSINSFIECVRELIENYPKDSLNVCMNLIGTHDTVRALTELSNASTYGTSKWDRLNYRMDENTYNNAVAKLKVASAIQYILPGIPSIYYGDEIGMQGFEDPLNREPMRWNSINEDVLTHYRLLGKIRLSHKQEILGDTNIFSQDNMLVIERKSTDKTLKLIANVSGFDCLIKTNKDTYDLLTNTPISKNGHIVANNSVLIIED